MPAITKSAVRGPVASNQMSYAPQRRSSKRYVLYPVLSFFLLQSLCALSIIDRTFYGEWTGKGGDPLTLLLNLAGISAGIFLFWSGAWRSNAAGVNRVLPLAAGGLLLISVLWSVDPRVTLTQGTLYFFVVLGAIGVAEELDADSLMDLIASLCGLCAVASVIQLFLSPEPGDFRGIFPQKNLLGEAMAVGVLAALHGIRTKGGFRHTAIVCLCTFVAFLSKSSTSILTIAMFICLDVLGRLYLRGGVFRTMSVCLSVAGISLIVILLANPDAIFDLFGKDSSLSGRTLIWPYVIDQIIERPLLGWGFDAFWSSLNPLSYQISKSIAGDNWWVFVVPNSHNGVLEMLLQVGFFGTALFVFIWSRNLILALKCASGPAAQIGLSSILLLAGIVVVGVSEEILLAAQQPWTNLLFVMGLMCEKKLRLAYRARRSGLEGSTRTRLNRAR